VHQLYCNILANNCESMDLFQKLGFERIGVKKEWVIQSRAILRTYVPAVKTLMQAAACG